MNSKNNLSDLFTPVLTEDGSASLFSKEFDEGLHSTSGAISETIHNYINGTKLEQFLIQNGQANILEVGFGMGLGLQCSLKLIENNPKMKIFFTSLEKETCLVDYFLSEVMPNSFKVKKSDKDSITLFATNIEVKILFGDARESIFRIDRETKFDCIFQDPFSPKKNPRLWTIEWFLDLKRHFHSNSILSTYSASSSVRKTLLNAGLNIQSSKGFGKKKTITQASIGFETSDQILQQVASIKIPILRDQDVPSIKVL